MDRESGRAAEKWEKAEKAESAVDTCRKSCRVALGIPRHAPCPVVKNRNFAVKHI